MRKISLLNFEHFGLILGVPQASSKDCVRLACVLRRLKVSLCRDKPVAPRSTRSMHLTSGESRYAALIAPHGHALTLLAIRFRNRLPFARRHCMLILIDRDAAARNPCVQYTLRARTNLERLLFPQSRSKHGHDGASTRQLGFCAAGSNGCSSRRLGARCSWAAPLVSEGSRLAELLQAAGSF